MTDNQGTTVYFGETIIIFTSNIGLTTVEKDEYGRPQYDESGNPKKVPAIMIEDPLKQDSAEFRQHVTETVTEGVKNYFTGNGRPELLNRLGEENIVVFQFINKDGAEAICESKLRSICEQVKKQKGIDILTEDVLEELKLKAVKERANGGRGVGNMLEREILNPLSRFLCEIDQEPKCLKCRMDKEKNVIFEVV